MGAGLTRPFCLAEGTQPLPRSPSKTSAYSSGRDDLTSMVGKRVRVPSLPSSKSLLAGTFSFGVANGGSLVEEVGQA